MSDTVSCLSVPVAGGRLMATMPGDCYEAHKRLRDDDPIWAGFQVYLHWQHFVPNARLSRRTPLSKHIKFVPDASDPVVPPSQADFMIAADQKAFLTCSRIQAKASRGLPV